MGPPPGGQTPRRAPPPLLRHRLRGPRPLPGPPRRAGPLRPRALPPRRTRPGGRRVARLPRLRPGPPHPGAGLAGPRRRDRRRPAAGARRPGRRRPAGAAAPPALRPLVRHRAERPRLRRPLPRRRGGPAVLPALVAKHLHGVPFVLTEHGLHLREQYRGYRTAPYRWPVRALLLAFFRQLTAETYRQAAVLTPGSGYDRRWQERCGADPERIRVVHESTPRPAASGSAPSPNAPPWSGRAPWSPAATRS
ncbi:DUF3492 domain-containing protein [Kitasatospora arboriphila]